MHRVRVWVWVRMVRGRSQNGVERQGVDGSGGPLQDGNRMALEEMVRAQNGSGVVRGALVRGTGSCVTGVNPKAKYGWGHGTTLSDPSGINEIKKRRKWT